ncbi:MAG: PPOX class F420-dependent oxidoreductase [Actinomycetota bacterium]|nr:PPOX class F420-dependent oxidoreductase [Actinomycetota bacterium]
MDLSADLVELLNARSTCYVATIMPDGSPQLTQTWVDTDGEKVIINSVRGFVKVRNLQRDPRVALVVSDPANSSRYFQVRGRVTNITEAGGADHIEKLSRKYTGQPYSWYGGREQVRVIITIEPEHISTVG